MTVKDVADSAQSLSKIIRQFLGQEPEKTEPEYDLDIKDFQELDG